MKALVTGGAGFIGSHLCEALIARGDAVWCVDNLRLGKLENVKHLRASERFRFFKLDVLSTSEMDRLFRTARFDIIFHLAANSDIQEGSRDHELDLRLNLLSAHAILEAMLRHGVSKIFFSSTSAVFGESTDVLREDSGPMHPISFYGASKLAAESYISVYVNNHGFKAWILRFPNVVGERATHGAIFDFIKRLRADPSRLVVLGNGKQTKPYLYVKDLVDAILLVVGKAQESLAVYHVAGSGYTSVQQIAEIVTSEMGLEIPIEYTGGDRGWIGDVPRFRYDTAKITALGFSPTYCSTEAVRISVRKILGKESL